MWNALPFHIYSLSTNCKLTLSVTAFFCRINVGKLNYGNTNIMVKKTFTPTSNFVNASNKAAIKNSLESFLMSTHEVSGLRFQSIVSLKNGEVIAQEVLTSVSGDPGTFFASIPAALQLSLLLWQLDEISSMPSNYWCNLSINVLSEPYLINQFIAWGPAKTNISIELQDPENVKRLDRLQYNRLRAGVLRLQQHGWNIILDDLSRLSVDDINPADFQFSVVKFDREEIRNNPELEQQIDYAHRLASFIVLEGIETSRDLELAILFKADAGQGFLWPEVKINCNVPDIIAHRAILWERELESIRNHRISIHINSNDSYFIIAITDLLCGIDRTEPEGIINFVETPRGADLSILVSETAPICLSCRRYRQGHDDKPAKVTIAFTDQDKQSLNGLTCITQSVSLRHSVADIYQSLGLSIRSLYREKSDVLATQRTTRSVCRIHTLTTGEREVMQLTGSGFTPAIIASKLGCNVKIVSKFRRSTMRKLGMARSTEFIRMSCVAYYPNAD